MRVLMIAPPGAGKGTQGALIAAHFDIPHIATGELLRDHVARRTALGRAVQTYLDRGELVPDQVVLDMVREAMVAAKAAGGGYVLDGIPRNMPQARATYLIGRELEMTADVALHLQAGDAELMRRLLARAALEHRSDDTPDIIAQRLALYHDVTSPIISWYRDRGILVSVDAMRSAPPGKPLGGYSARLDGRFHLDMDNPPRPSQDGKTGKGSPATARSGGAERIEPPLGADCWAWRHRPLWSHIEIICARRQTLGAFVQIRSPGRTWSALCRPSE